MKLFKICIFSFFCLVCSLVSAQNKFKVVLDAGHGGKDPGKVHGKVFEKDIALKIVLLVGNALEKDADFKVIYTRKDDRFIELYERGRIANRAKADLFISVHCNAASSESASGSESYVLGLHANEVNFEVAKTENGVIYLEDNYKEHYAGYDVNSPESIIGVSIMQEEFLDQSIQIAKGIQQNFTRDLGRKNRGVKQAGFIVLHQTYMPSVLIEIGFVTNTNERNYLLSEKGQQEIANGIVKAIKNYHRNLKGNTSVSTSVKKDSVQKEKNKISEKETKVEKEEQKMESIRNQENTEYHLPLQTPFYTIQIASSPRNLPTKPENFKGLKSVFKEKVANIYLYYFGEESTLEKAKILQEEAQKKGFSDAKIILKYKSKKN